MTQVRPTSPASPVSTVKTEALGTTSTTAVAAALQTPPLPKVSAPVARANAPVHEHAAHHHAMGHSCCFLHDALAGASALTGKPELGSYGFDSAGMDTSVKPGDDFVAYAGGKAIAGMEIPADRSTATSFIHLDELSKARTKQLIEDVSKEHAATGTDAQRIGDVFNSFMNETAVEALGAKPVQSTLDAIANINSASDVAAMFGTFLRTGTKTPFYLSVDPDDKSPMQNIVRLQQSGLSMPDRDYYFKDGEKLVEARAALKPHISKMLELAGIADGAKKAEGIYALEEAIAQAHWTQVQNRDADATYNKWASADFTKNAPGMDWNAFFKAAGIDGQKDLLVAQPSAFTGIAKLVSSFPVETWKDYLAYRAVKSGAPLLSKAFVDENFNFNGKTLSGQPQNAERWKRGVDLVNAYLGEAVGKLYVAKYFPPETKRRADELVKNVIAAMGERLSRLEWMTPETKVKAQEKLAGFTAKIGYPDVWRDYSALEVKPNDLFGNAKRAEAFEYQRNLDKLKGPVDRNEWFMTPMTVNAYANPVMNEIVFPAAIMQPPFFDPNADDAVNYGGIGAVIGHEISHHFDDQGRKYDKNGALVDWWNKDDVERFTKLTDKVVAQFNGFEPLPGHRVNGELTLGENMADLAGITVAYDAYQRSLAGKEAPKLEGMTGDQRFYLGWTQVWRAKYRDAALIQRLLTDPHSPGMVRAGVVRNLDPWYTAFAVTPEQKMYLKPEQRLRVW